MAQRRMFSPKIVSSDAFLDMPATSQSLYFHLGMHADDDGFVNPRYVMRMCGVAEDDLKVLILKRFVLPFDNGVIVIKHWKINNLIKSDRYTSTVYLEQKKKLRLKENGAYTERKLIGTILEPQVRLGKVNKVSIDNIAETSSAEHFNLNYLKEKMLLSSDKRMPIISLYWTYRKIDFKNKEQYQAGLKRELRPAGNLIGYQIERIKEVMFWLNGEEWIDWTLETVHKYIDRDLNKINEKKYENVKRPFIKA